MRVPGWLICAVIVDAERRAVLVEAAHADGLGALRVPAAELPAGVSPETSAPVDAIEQLLGRPIVPMWMRDVEMAADEQSGVMVILATAEPGRDLNAGGADADWLGRAILGLEHGLAATFRPVTRGP